MVNCSQWAFGSRTQKARTEKRERPIDLIPVADSVGYDSSLNLGGFSISANGHIAYRPGGARRVQLTWFDRGGNPVGTAGQADMHGLQFPDLSPDERLVVVYREVENSPDIWHHRSDWRGRHGLLVRHRPVRAVTQRRAALPGVACQGRPHRHVSILILCQEAGIRGRTPFA